jgi:hypothetical protein
MFCHEVSVQLSALSPQYASYGHVRHASIIVLKLEIRTMMREGAES